MRQTGACESGLRPSCHLHPEIRSMTERSCEMIEIGTSRLAPVARHDRSGLMVPQKHHHEILVAVPVHEGDQRA